MLGLRVSTLTGASEPFCLGINFASDEPDGAGSVVDGAAGIRGTTVWNNVEGAEGSAEELDIQINGASAASDISVSWSSPNTWSSTGRGEENNTASGNDKNLMTGYIDTNAEDPISVTVSGINTELSYDRCDCLHQGGVNDKGGDYSIGDQTFPHTDTVAFDGDFVYGELGDYLVFKEISGEFLRAIPTNSRNICPACAHQRHRGGHRRWSGSAWWRWWVRKHQFGCCPRRECVHRIHRDAQECFQCHRHLTVR